MQSIQLVFDRVKEIKWFENCGKEGCSIDINYIQVKDWNAAAKKCNSSMWENVQLEARNKLTVALHSSWPEKYRMWNDITDQANKLLIDDVSPTIIEFFDKNNIDKNLIHSVQWDILAAMMEFAYSPYVKPGFYTMLLNVYDQGHFPCGWKGKWPEGSLIIY